MTRYFEGDSLSYGEEGKFYKWITFPNDECTCDDYEFKEITELEYYKAINKELKAENQELYNDIHTLINGEEGKNWYEKGQVTTKWKFFFMSENLLMRYSR